MGLDTLVKTSDRVGDGNNLLDIVNSLHWCTTIIIILPLTGMKVMKCSTNSLFLVSLYFLGKYVWLRLELIFVHLGVISNPLSGSISTHSI